MMRRRLYIVDGYRTPFTKIGTELSNEPVQNLGISTAKHLLASTGIDPSQIDHVVYGCVNQPADAQNVARVISVRSGVPKEVPAVSVHRNCASGFESITYACDKANNDKGDIFLVGGVESMSQMPLLFSKIAQTKFGKLMSSRSIAQKIKSALKFRPSDFAPEIAIKLGLVDPLCGIGMGDTADKVAREFNVSRRDQDAFAQRSHNGALLYEDHLRDEISPYYKTNDNCLRSHSGDIVEKDNGPRPPSDKLFKLKPIFDRREGTVTAGNSSQITDGGVSLLLMTEEGLHKTGMDPIGVIVDYAYAGCEPATMGLGPVFSTDKMLKSTGANINEFDLIEINEAFAAQVLAVLKLAKDTFGEIPLDKLNLQGGSIALGHPLAASGSRLVLTMIKQLINNNLNKGLVTACVGGGQGGTLWIEKA